MIRGKGSDRGQAWVGVRDTKARRAGQLTVSARAWRSVLDRLR